MGTEQQNSDNNLKPRAQRVNVYGHGILYIVNGAYYTTPTPKPWSVPVEFAEFGRMVAGPSTQMDTTQNTGWTSPFVD
jgi:hypothetical protein